MKVARAPNNFDSVELVRLCCAGDASAWEFIVTTYSRRIFNLAYRFTFNVEAAEDLTQEVFIKIAEYKCRRYTRACFSLTLD